MPKVFKVIEDLVEMEKDLGIWWFPMTGACHTC